VIFRIILLILSLTVVVASIGEFVYEQRSADSVRGKCRVKCWDRFEELVIEDPLAVYVNGEPVTDVAEYFGSSYPVRIGITAFPRRGNYFTYAVALTEPFNGSDVFSLGFSLLHP